MTRILVGEIVGGRIISKVEPPHSVDRLDVESERKQEVKDNSKMFALDIWKN